MSLITSLCGFPKIDVDDEFRRFRRRKRFSLPFRKERSYEPEFEVSGPFAVHHEFHLGADVRAHATAEDSWDEARWRLEIETRLREQNAKLAAACDFNFNAASQASMSDAALAGSPSEFGSGASPSASTSAHTQTQSTTTLPEKRQSLIKRKPVPPLDPVGASRGTSAAVENALPSPIVLSPLLTASSAAWPTSPNEDLDTQENGIEVTPAVTELRDEDEEDEVSNLRRDSYQSASTSMSSDSSPLTISDSSMEGKEPQIVAAESTACNVQAGEIQVQVASQSALPIESKDSGVSIQPIVLLKQQSPEANVF